MYIARLKKFIETHLKYLLFNSRRSKCFLFLLVFALCVDVLQ